MTMLSVRNVGKQYPVRRAAGMLTKELLSRLLRIRKVDKFWALKDIAFDVKSGQSLGIIGPNGSGKSTLLRVIAGITTPTVGEVVVHGRIASLLELGAGFHPFLTGRENVFLNGALLGIKKDAIARDFDRIVEFSGIDQFVDVPVKDYSSGMYVRLAFAVAIHSDPDIFLVDEVLSVGDEEFQLRCRERIRELQRAGKTIVFVSHDLAQVNEICDELVLLRQGEMVRYGETDTTINYYLQTVGDQKGMITLHQGDLEAVFNNGRLSLFWRKQLLTKRTGGYACVKYHAAWHETTQAKWEIVASSPSEFTALGTAWRLPIEYRWRMSLTSERTLELTFEMRATKRIEMEHKHFSLLLRPEFSQWATAYEDGPFEGRQPGDRDWRPLTVLSGASDFMAAYGEKDDFPAIVERVIERGRSDKALVLNSDYAIDAGILQVEGGFSEEELDLMAKGDFATVTRIEIAIEEDSSSVRKRIADAAAARTVSAGDLRAFFDRGRLHLEWRGTEFTHDKCCYTTALSGGMWHDSISMSYDTHNPEPGTLVVVGRMLRLPVTQRWTVRAHGPESIAWSVELIVQERIEIAEWDTTVVLAPHYERWSTPHETGKFPPISSDQANWVHLNRTMEVGSWIAAETTAAGLPPQLRFETSSGDRSVPTAVNTSHLERGRALQIMEARSGGSRIMPPGEHQVFSGTIEVAGSETVGRSAAGTQSELPFD